MTWKRGMCLKDAVRCVCLPFRPSRHFPTWFVLCWWFKIVVMCFGKRQQSCVAWQAFLSWDVESEEGEAAS